MKILLVYLLLVFSSSNVFSEAAVKGSNEEKVVSAEDEVFYNVSFGVSAFECLFGIEVLKGKNSLGLGGCGQVSYRYYNSPNGDSRFYGLFVGQSSGYEQYESKEVIGGIVYEDKESVYAGFGAGYRWQWPSSWNLAASLSVHYMEEEFFNPGQPKKNDTSVILFPGIVVGYKF